MRGKVRAGYLILLILFALSLFITLSHPAGQVKWYSFLVKEGGSREKLVSLLADEGITRVSTSAGNVVYSDFTSLKEISLSDIPDRLLDSDKRFDPYLRALYDLFHPDEGERVFFQTGRSPLALFTLSLTLGPLVKWEQLGSPLLFPLGVSFFILLGGLNIRRFRNHAFIPLLIQVLWLPGLLVSTGALLAVLPFIIFCEINFLLGFPRLRKILPEAVLLLIFGIFIIRRGGSPIIPGELFLTLSAGILLKGRMRPDMNEITRKVRKPLFHKKTEHPLFEPAYFGPAPAQSLWDQGIGEGALSLILALVMALPFLFPYATGKTDPFRIPGQGEFLNHIYYQENILYAPAWGDRSPLRVNNYRWERETGRILVDNSAVARFSDEWIHNRVELYKRGYGDSFILSLPPGTITLPQIYLFDFDKYMKFAIIILFFLSKLVLSGWKTSGTEKKSLQINKRGREVA
ncbi:MAG: hypothetical protein JXA95_07595 [Spirochaetales bacterium]|nr:hypothetical protein [Spirochaetales bacterium]